MYMEHEHSVIDKDTHFIIDADMKITCASEVKALKRGDHAAERYTFEMPRYIEGHDMSLCNKVEAHYNNVKYDSATRTTTTNGSFDEVDDFKVSDTSEDTVTWSWLVKGDATQLDGSVNFCIRFACTSGDVIEYQKFTEIYADIPVGDTIYNTEAVAKEYYDVLQTVINSALDQAKESGEFNGEPGKDGRDGKDGEDGFSPSVAVENIECGHRVTITDKDGEKTFDVMDGKDDEGGGVTSWNDLQDKPFEVTESVINLIPNGVSYDASMQMLIGLAASIPAIGETYTVNYNGADYDVVPTEFPGMVVLGNMAANG